MYDKQNRQLTSLTGLLRMMEELGTREAVRYNNGYRTFVWTYADLTAHIAGCAAFFDQRGLVPGQRILMWGENRPEWIAVFWAAVARGLQVVPVDPASSLAFVRSIQERTKPQLLVCTENLDVSDLDLPAVRMVDLGRLESPEGIRPVQAQPRDVVEIVFTSGTTGEPKGVMHTHDNICADLRAVDSEVHPLRRYIRFLRPLRILTILPFSHMFGQALGLFIPVLLGSPVVMARELSPGRLIDIIHREKATAMVTVPGHLSGLQRYVQAGHDCSQRMEDYHPSGIFGLIKRWVRFRDVHKRFGWRFVALVVGGAQLRRSVEYWWSGLGFLVIQGYGLTEASPVVTLNNPLRITSGSLGKVLEGQTVRIAEDGEILVRGPNVARPFGVDGADTGEDWLATGDLGHMDADGNLYFLGRKKDVIVTPEGHNVFPEDVEAVLLDAPGVSDCAVVGREAASGRNVHAVLIPADQEADIEALIRSANARLESFQRIRSWSVWPEVDFPRTPSTGKIKRHQVAQAVNGRSGPEPPNGRAASLEDLLAAFTSRSPDSFSDQQHLGEDLGLSSLDRVELLSYLEAYLGIELEDEEAVSISTVGDLRVAAGRERIQQADPSPPSRGGRGAQQAAGGRSLESGETSDRREAEGLLQPGWAQFPVVRLARRLLHRGLVLPVTGMLMHPEVEGRDVLEALKPPVLFAANHASHLDTAAVVYALPPAWRGRVAPAMLQEYFAPLLRPREYGIGRRWLSRAAFLAVCAFMNAYPLPQRTGGLRRALRYTGRLVERGCCPLIFPEGRRTPDGHVHSFQPGIALMAKRLDVPVVPIGLKGLFEVLPARSRLPRPGRVRVRFGLPVYPSPEVEAAVLSTDLEKRVRRLAED